MTSCCQQTNHSQSSEGRVQKAWAELAAPRRPPGQRRSPRRPRPPALCRFPSAHQAGRQAVPALCAPRRTRAALHRGDGIRQRPWSRALGPRLGSLQPRLKGLSPRGNRFIRVFVACAGAVSRWWRPDRRAQRSAVWRRGPQAARPQRRVGLRQPELRVRPGATWRRGHRRAKGRSRRPAAGVSGRKGLRGCKRGADSGRRAASFDEAVKRRAGERLPCRRLLRDPPGGKEGARRRKERLFPCAGRVGS